MSEWKAFGALAVKYLGMPAEAMPLLNANVDLNVDLNVDDNKNLNLDVTPDEKVEENDKVKVQINDAVVHKSFGPGTVTAIDERYIYVRFKDRESKFFFPDVFERGYLRCLKQS